MAKKQTESQASKIETIEDAQKQWLEDDSVVVVRTSVLTEYGSEDPNSVKILPYKKDVWEFVKNSGILQGKQIKIIKE